MPNFILFFIVLFCAKSTLFSQQELSWNDLAEVSFRNVYNVHYDDYFLKPTFGAGIESYKGSKIIIRGYFIDFSSEDDQFYMVSRNPMSSCFFCGGGGPETIVEVIFKNKPNYKMDQVVKVTGILELNEDDVDHCNYILKQAIGELVK
ncbi:hypothetical protein SAMN04487910_2874 [Aquimarina amphilecti]|uniref:DUF3299 domain-containing protein n=1 Tax=Aquimarina amphilecti TaxID=1038014 RepID=A0A1H7RU63_AQUAM|nr:hypothetical protein [Aquimarina amphilecti]SEL63763.1 hypothetical protein SAMN04487910_2874 [Aquimarina amphilecti]